MRRIVINIFLACLNSFLLAQEVPYTHLQIDPTGEASTSVPSKGAEDKAITYEEALALLMEGHNVNWEMKAQTKDFTAEKMSRLNGTIPEFSPTDASNIFTEKHGVYRFIMGDNGIEKIIVNMVGLFPSDEDPTRRYAEFRLNKYLDITAREEALYFPRQGGEVEFEFIVDNADVSLYFEGDFTNRGRDFYLEKCSSPFSATDAEATRAILEKSRKGESISIYSVKYKLVIPPTGNYSNREVFACHWSCSWLDCYYGAFNLVVVQLGSAPERKPVYVW